MSGQAPFDLRPRPRDWGIRIPGVREHVITGPVRSAPVPDAVVLPLHQNVGPPSMPVVRPGDAVAAGQPVAEPRAGVLGAAVHASISGTVIAVEPRPAGAGTGLVPAVVIAGDGQDRSYGGYPSHAEPARLSAADVRRAALEGGVVGLGGALFPTDTKLNPGSGIDALILNGAECDPYVSCDQALMRERPGDVLLGAQSMLHALETNHCIVAVKAEMSDVQAVLTDAIRALGDDRIELAVVPNRYPAGGERQLIAYLLHREVPSGGLPWDVGTVCQNVATAAALAAMLERGEPVTRRIVTVAGNVCDPVNIEARIGTPMRELVELAGGYAEDAGPVLTGGAMMGTPVANDTLPVTKSTNCILVADRQHAQPPVERPCIRCGACAWVCPARLMPQDLLTLMHTGGTPALERRGILDCIECGACDYVCPSDIPITHQLATGKKLVWQHHADDQHARRSRARFEARGHRKVREAEKRKASLEAQTEALEDTDARDAIASLMRRVDGRRDDRDQN